MKRAPDEILGFSGRLADESGAIAMRLFRSGIDLALKPDRSPVTIAGQQAEAAFTRVRGPKDHFLESKIRGRPVLSSADRRAAQAAPTRISAPPRETYDGGCTGAA
jgi:hypothetical protein